MFRQYPKLVAALLLVVFTQKAGLRLWMHDWFHESKVARAVSTPSVPQILLQCDCFDDAMMPLLGSPVFTLPPPVSVHTSRTVNHHSPFISACKVYFSLKGPPVASLLCCQLS
ncbi:MAG TPA: hypothetical protein VGR89_15465 [Puia sp.]|nr:hypothetical protein [Puia sp.]